MLLPKISAKHTFSKRTGHDPLENFFLVSDILPINMTT